MKTYTFSFSTNPYISQGTYIIQHDDYYAKGKTKIVVDLSQIDESKTYVKNVSIDWGDGSPEENYFLNIVKDYYTESIIPEVLYNKDVSVCTSYEHTYYPTQYAYFTKYQCVIKLTFMNDYAGYIYIPVISTQGSFYDDLDDVYIINTQMLPLSSNNTFLNIQSTNNKYVLPVITN